MIASLGGDVKPLALSPTSLHTKLVGDVKERTSLFEKSRGSSPGVVDWPVYMYSWLGGWGEIMNGLIAAAKLTSDPTPELNCKVHLDILCRKCAI